MVYRSLVLSNHSPLHVGLRKDYACRLRVRNNKGGVIRSGEQSPTRETLPHFFASRHSISIGESFAADILRCMTSTVRKPSFSQKNSTFSGSTSRPSPLRRKRPSASVCTMKKRVVPLT